jgi:deazaflavin-dependent oxidoreductase (nitroreductase family)
MTEDATTLRGPEHVRRYRETGGEVGHIWKEGSTVLLLTTTGRKSGEPRTTPLIYAEDGDHYVIVASKGGAPEHPLWYLSLQENPEVHVRVLGERFTAHAETLSPEDKARVWPHLLDVYAPYADYQKKTDREIPVVRLKRV